MDGSGYTELVEHPDGAAHLGAWYAIVEIASRREIRGMLPEAVGKNPHDVGGICRSLSRISRLPCLVFQDVVPRLLEIGWIEECNMPQIQPVAGKSGESADMSGESADKAAAQGREWKGITGKGKTQQGSAAALTVVRADRFAEFIAPWPRDAHPDQTVRMWLSCVETEADEGLAFMARDRYLASDEVARGVVTEPTRWLQDQKSAKWGGKWPPAITRAPNGKASTGERVLAKMAQRITNGEKPL